MLKSSKSYKSSKAACFWHEKKYSSFVAEGLKVEYQPPKSENNKYKIYFHKLYKVYLCMLISFSVKCSKHYSATFSTQKGSMPNKRSLFFVASIFFFFVFTLGEARGVLFSNAYAFCFSHYIVPLQQRGHVYRQLC